jgi:hypothetical protein
MARSGADVLSAHGPRRKVPASRLGTVGVSNSAGFEIKEQSCTNPTGFAVSNIVYPSHDFALDSVGTNAVAEPGVVDSFSDLPNPGRFGRGYREVLAPCLRRSQPPQAFPGN